MIGHSSTKFKINCLLFSGKTEKNIEFVFHCKRNCLKNCARYNL